MIDGKGETAELGTFVTTLLFIALGTMSLQLTVVGPTEDTAVEQSGEWGVEEVRGGWELV